MFIKSVTLEYATFKFATLVVEVTVNGAVPVTILETNLLAVIVPIPPAVAIETLPMFAFPLTLNN